MIEPGTEVIFARSVPFTVDGHEFGYGAGARATVCEWQR